MVQPGRYVDTVGDGIDRDILDGAVGPEGSPHLSCDLTMPLGDTVMKEAHPESKRGHVEPGARVVRITPERHELIPAEIERRAVAAEVLRHQVFGEDVMGRRDRRVGGEDRRAPDLFARFLGGHTGSEPFPEFFEEGKR